MRRTLLAAAALGAPLLLSLAFIGCGPPKDNDSGNTTDSGGGGAGTTNTGGPAAKLTALPGKEGAVLKGKVTLKGGKPDTAALTAQFQDAIKGKPADLKTCFDLAPDDQKTEQKWVLGPDGGVGNVVVWIQPPEGSFFQVAADQNGKGWPAEVGITQPHCAFVPHVSWAVPNLANPDDPKKLVPSGQKFTVSNTAAVSHNTKWSQDNGPNSGSLPPLKPDTPPTPVTLKGNNQLVHFQCDIHPWMDAYVWVFNHPYAAVTKADGTYEIKNVPAGGKVRITAWHELGPNQGFLTAARIKGDEIELKGDATEHNFELEVK